MMAVRFYLQRLIAQCSDRWSHLAHGATNYHALVDTLDEHARLNDDSVLYVTFNYDTMMELAITDEMKIPFGSVDDYIAHDRAKLFKLHGSCHWGHQVEYPPLTQATSAEELYIEKAFEVVVSPTIELHEFPRASYSYIPALAVPVQDKAQFECPLAHIDKLVELLPRVSRVLVIGWRGMEAHFMRLLQDNLRRRLERLLIVCNSPEDGYEVSMRLDSACEDLSILYSVESALGFSDLVSSSELDEFLA